jgi:hypothetical protein
MGLRFHPYGKAMSYNLKYHPDVKRDDLPKIEKKQSKD